jgi:hypothetical protein
MDVTGDTTGDTTQADITGWKPTWDIGLDAGRHASAGLTLADLADLQEDTGLRRDRPLYARVNGSLVRVMDVSVMPLRGINVLELDT